MLVVGGIDEVDGIPVAKLDTGVRYVAGNSCSKTMRVITVRK